MEVALVAWSALWWGVISDMSIYRFCNDFLYNNDASIYIVGGCMYNLKRYVGALGCELIGTCIAVKWALQWKNRRAAALSNREAAAVAVHRMMASAEGEIRAIKDALLAAYGPEHVKYVHVKYVDRICADAMPYVDTVFAHMIHPDVRTSIPDPLRSYDKVAREVVRDSTNIHVEDLPRYMMLCMVMYHLCALRAALRQPAEATTFS